MIANTLQKTRLTLWKTAHKSRSTTCLASLDALHTWYFSELRLPSWLTALTTLNIHATGIRQVSGHANCERDKHDGYMTAHLYCS